jgi:hypothetical protein
MEYSVSTGGLGHVVMVIVMHWKWSWIIDEYFRIVTKIL